MNIPNSISREVYMDKVNILGQQYEIKLQKEEENPKLKDADGICEFYSKEIVINDVKEDDETFNEFKKYKNKVLRHEIIHAFIHESGLDVMSEWARNEEMVDFFAIQIPKIAKAFKELGILEEGEGNKSLILDGKGNVIAVLDEDGRAINKDGVEVLEYNK